MPPSGQLLPDADNGKLLEWIADGAVFGVLPGDSSG
jgi:hypothetical protein